jgi:hypothetical protein
MMNSVNELIDDVLWRELVQHLERRKPTVNYRRPIVDLKLHYVVTDKTNDDKIVKRSGIRNAHSLIANFLSMLGYGWYINQANPFYFGIFDNNGSPYAGTNATYGIVVGIGSQTKSISLRDLQNSVSPSSTGLSYSAESYSGPISINNNASAVLREIRSFTNNSTSNYTLTEIGVYGSTNYSGGLLPGFNPWTTSSTFGGSRVLLAYDLLSPSVVVQPTQSVTFEYDWIVNV